jgi:hypothetical protein
MLSSAQNEERGVVRLGWVLSQERPPKEVQARSPGFQPGAGGGAPRPGSVLSRTSVADGSTTRAPSGTSGSAFGERGSYRRERASDLR